MPVTILEWNTFWVLGNLTLSLFPTGKLFVARLKGDDGSVIGYRAGLVEVEMSESSGEVDKRIIMDTDIGVKRVEVLDMLFGFLEDVGEKRYQKLKTDARDADDEEDEERDDDLDMADSDEEQGLRNKENKTVKQPAAKKPPSKTKQPTKKKVGTPDKGKAGWEPDTDFLSSNSESR